MSRDHTRLYAAARAPAAGVVCLAAALCLSGCSSTQLRSFFGPPDDEREVATAPPPAAIPAHTAPPARRPAAGRAAAIPRMRPIVPAPVVSVAGLGEDEVRRILGEPNERAEIDGRRTWIYRGAGCRVEVTFFREVTRGSYSALAHKAVRSDTGDAIDPAAPCARGFARAGR